MGEIQNERQYRNALNKLQTYKMELTSKLLEQLVFNTIGKIEGYMLIIMDKSTHEEHLFQPLQINIKQFKIAVTFLTGYNGIFNVTSKNSNLYFTRPINDDDFTVISILPGVHQLESPNDENKRNIIKEGHFSEADYPFTIKPKFSTLGIIMEISRRRPLVSVLPSDSIRNLLGFNSTTLYENYNLSQNPDDILSFDNFFLETDKAEGMIFTGKRTGLNHKFAMDVDPGYDFFWKIQRKSSTVYDGK